MRLAIIGAGGVGGYFGARLAAAGTQVTFVARGAHGAAMAREGLRVLSPRGDLVIERPRVVAEPAEAGPCDLVLLCVKLWDLEAVSAAIAPLLSGGSAVLSLQNGVVAAERLCALYGADRVMGGVAQISAEIAQPGVIRHKGDFARLVFGELDGRPSARGAALFAACEGAGIDARLSDDIEAEIWRKFIMLASLAALTARHRKSLGGCLADLGGREELAALVGEAAAVARAKGIAIGEDSEARTLAMLSSMPPEMKASMLIDLERGQRLELPWLSGTVVALGRELGIETPAHDRVVTELTPFVDGRRGDSRA